LSLSRSRIKEWAAYRDNAIQAYQAKFGDRLIAVAEHLDEPHPHIHIFVVPKPGEDIGVCHPGLRAQKAARKMGKSPSVYRSAYRAAMTEFQDWVHETLGKKWRQSRCGLRRQRLSRMEYLAKKKQEDAETCELRAKEAMAELNVKWALMVTYENDLKELANLVMSDAAYQQLAQMTLHLRQAQQAQCRGDNASAATHLEAGVAAIPPAIQRLTLEPPRPRRV
jgi:hypothetical protein